MTGILKPLLSSFLFFFLLILSGCVHSSYSPPTTPIFDKLIVPGERIGPIALGMPQADVLKILGTPPHTNVGEWASMYYYADLAVWIKNDSNHVIMIQTSSPEYATADGIRVGMSEPEVKAKRGNPTRRKEEEGPDYLPYKLEYWYEPHLEINFDPKKDYCINYIIIGEYK